MPERIRFADQPWHIYYQQELKGRYSPILSVLAQELQKGTKKRQNDTRRFVWWDIENHSMAVTVAANIMARVFNNKLGATVEETTAGALLHDITKPQEIIFDDLKDTTKKRVMIQSLVTEGYATQADIKRLNKNPQQALSIYETAVHRKAISDLIRERRGTLTRFGNPEKILTLSDSSGIPVIYLPKDNLGHYLHSLCQRVVFVADQLAQGTDFVELETRHQRARKRYNPLEIDKLYTYAYRCGDEIAHEIGLESHRDLPTWIESQITK